MDDFGHTGAWLAAAVAGLAVASVIAVGVSRTQDRQADTPSPASSIRTSPVSPASRMSTRTNERGTSKPPLRATRTRAVPAESFRDLRREADRLVAAGKLEQAQELYLQILVLSPRDQAAMRGLISVRKRLRGDPARLRYDAARFRAAIASRTETEEHYTPLAMQILVEANSAAAAELASARPPEAATPREAIRERGGATTSGTAVRQPLAKTPGPAPAATLPRPVGEPGEPLALARVGPVAGQSRATQIVEELTSRGFTAMLQATAEGPYVVLSPVLPLGAATRRAAALSDNGVPGQIVIVGEGRAQIEFGKFLDPAQADALAAGIRRRGFAAHVVRPASRLVILVGPHPHSVIRRVGKTIEGLGMSVPVTVVPAP